MDIADHLKKRAELIAEVLSTVPDSQLWRFGSYKHGEGLRVEKFIDDGAELLYQRSGDKYGRIRLKNIAPYGEVLQRKDKDISLGEELIDSLTADALNYDGVVAVPISYDGTFRKLVSAEDAFDWGLTESIETTLGTEIGGEAALQKYTAEIKIGFESRQDWHHQDSTESEEARSAGISPESPAGFDIRYKLDRYSVRKKLYAKGMCQVDHGVRAGKMEDGNWKGKHGENHKFFPKYGNWDSFYLEFLPVIKGEGRRDLDFADWFKRHPAKPALIKGAREAASDTLGAYVSAV